MNKFIMGAALVTILWGASDIAIKMFGNNEPVSVVSNNPATVAATPVTATEYGLSIYGDVNTVNKLTTETLKALAMPEEATVSEAQLLTDQESSLTETVSALTLNSSGL